MTLRSSFVTLIGAVALAGCSAAPAQDQVEDNGSSTTSDRATAILNAGVSAQLGGAKFLLDPLYDNHFGSLAEMDDALIEAIIAGVPPYEDVDAVLVSHAHGDHFSPEYFNRLMAAQSDVQIIAPEQAIADMREHELWQAGFAERITSIELRNGETSERISIAGSTVEAIRTPHAGWPERHADVHNVTYRVTGPSGTRIMHMGDADPAAQHFAANTRFFGRARTNLVVVPFWFFREDDVSILIDRTLNAQEAVGVHVPAQTPGWLAESEWRYFTRVGQEVEIAPAAN